MKKYFICICFLLISFSFLSNKVVSQVNSSSTSDQEILAMITMSFGEVLVKRELKKEWRQAVVGTEIFYGDRLETKETGNAEVTFNDGSVVFVSKESEIEFLNHEKNEKTKKNKTSIFLFLGSIWNSVNKGTEYEVETIHALATVKGTEFSMDTTSEKTVYIIKSGKVEIENQYGKILAERKESVTATEGVKPRSKRISSKEIKEREKIKEIESSYRIKLFIPKQININERYTVTGELLTDSGLFTERVNLTVSTKGIEMLNSDVQNRLDLTVVNGTFSFIFEAIDKDIEIGVSSTLSLSERFSITANDEAKTKRVYVEFKRNDGKIKRFHAVFDKLEK